MGNLKHLQRNLSSFKICYFQKQTSVSHIREDRSHCALNLKIYKILASPIRRSRKDLKNFLNFFFVKTVVDSRIN